MKIFDFGIGWLASDDKKDLFINTLKSECKARKLRFIFIEEKSLERLTSYLKRGRLKIKFYLDMASETFDATDTFTRFNYALKDRGTRIVDDPDDVRLVADKSITHYKLIRANVPVPFTVVIRNWEPTRRLTDEEKQGLGLPLVIKPALGYGQKGVKIIKQKYTLREIAEARQFSRGDNFLLQAFIEPLEIDRIPAWFRVYYLFGEIIPCWWNPFTNVFRQVTLKEMTAHRLLPLVRIASEIGRVTKIDWFSCEIAIDKATRKFVVVDYMNDQCALYPQSQHKDGVPDDLIVHIAMRIVEKAWEYIMGRPTLTYRAIWFPKIKVKDEDA